MHDRWVLKSFFAVASVTMLLLLLPLTAMQFTAEVRWGFEDFLAAGGLIFGVGAGIALVARYAKRTPLRITLIGILALAFFVVWAELAVGIFN